MPNISTTATQSRSDTLCHPPKTPTLYLLQARFLYVLHKSLLFVQHRHSFTGVEEPAELIGGHVLHSYPEPLDEPFLRPLRYL